MPNAARVNVDIASGHKIVQGSDTVYVNNFPLAYLSSVNAKGVAVVGGSTTVSSENKQAARKADDMADGNNITTGSLDVFIGDDVDYDIPANRALTEGDETDTFEPGSGAAHIENAKASGAFTPRDIKNINRSKQAIVPGPTDVKAPVNNAPLATDCGDIHDLVTNIPFGQTLDDIRLTTNFTLKSITRSPWVTYDHPVRSGYNGLSLDQLICNLKLLALNVLEPIKARYPTMVITNTWRPLQGNSLSQHPKGQACDLQFRGINPKQYYDIAQWIRDTLCYDQLLLEYKTTGTGLPWIHVSFTSTKNRAMVLTLLDDVTYGPGLTQLK